MPSRPATSEKGEAPHGDTIAAAKVHLFSCFFTTAAFIFTAKFAFFQERKANFTPPEIRVINCISVNYKDFYTS